MAISKVLLVKPVENLGGEGEQVSVKAGYARNFLYPQKIAIPVSKANKKQIEALIKARELREAKELENAQALSKAIEGMSIAFAVKTGEGGKMFGLGHGCGHRRENRRRRHRASEEGCAPRRSRQGTRQAHGANQAPQRRQNRHSFRGCFRESHRRFRERIQLRRFRRFSAEID